MPKLCGLSLADVPVVPLTPDYGGPLVSYADGVLDARFNRYVCVREGKLGKKLYSLLSACFRMFHNI